jgi:hypothetical protein
MTAGPAGNAHAAMLGLAAALAFGSGCVSDPPGADGRCAPSPGVSRAPGTITETVALVNALPKPATVACFVESLDRPLHVQLVESTFSAQPAAGARSPRVLLLLGSLVATVLPEGPGSELLEIGELVEPQRSLKAEIAFPVTAALDGAAPFRRVRVGAGTSCGVCHLGESRHDAVTYAEAFASAALRPAPGAELDLALLAREHDRCDAGLEPQRCAFLEALFDHGEVRPARLPDSLPTLGD